MCLGGERLLSTSYEVLDGRYRHSNDARKWKNRARKRSCQLVIAMPPEHTWVLSLRSLMSVGSGAVYWDWQLKMSLMHVSVDVSLEARRRKEGNESLDEMIENENSATFD